MASQVIVVDVKSAKVDPQKELKRLIRESGRNSLTLPAPQFDLRGYLETDGWSAGVSRLCRHYNRRPSKQVLQRLLHLILRRPHIPPDVLGRSVPSHLLRKPDPLPLRHPPQGRVPEYMWMQVNLLSLR